MHRVDARRPVALPEKRKMPSIEELMDKALMEARRASQHGDIPIGALVIHDGEVIAARHNEREISGDPTAHAEVLAIRDAARHLGSWRLDGTTVVTTLEPCVMCAGALVLSRVARVVIGAVDLKAGAMGSLYNVANDPRLNHDIEVITGVSSDKCGALVTEFFAARRPMPT